MAQQCTQVSTVGILVLRCYPFLSVSLLLPLFSSLCLPVQKREGGTDGDRQTAADRGQRREAQRERPQEAEKT